MRLTFPQNRLVGGSNPFRAGPLPRWGRIEVNLELKNRGRFAIACPLDEQPDFACRHGGEPVALHRTHGATCEDNHPLSAVPVLNLVASNPLTELVLHDLIEGGRLAEVEFEPFPGGLAGRSIPAGSALAIVGAGRRVFGAPMARSTG